MMVSRCFILLYSVLAPLDAVARNSGQSHLSQIWFKESTGNIYKMFWKRVNGYPTTAPTSTFLKNNI